MSSFFQRPPAGAIALPARRRFVQGLVAGGAVASLGWPGRGRASTGDAPVLTGTRFNLSIGEMPVNFTGRRATAVTVNGTLPAPVLRWREGATVQLDVTNALPANTIHGHHTSIHWHGLVLPAHMDGVPGISFNGIQRGETYPYRFDVKQSGTYWYHAHSGFQEQAGVYGAIVIDPIAPPPFRVDREHVVLLSDWTDLDPVALFERLKKMPEHDNLYMRTVGDFMHDVREGGLAATLRDRRAWGGMRMTPTDLSDVNANTYTYLMNGNTSGSNWTGLFRHGERVLLRLINGSSMTHFDVRIPGLKLTVVAADGLYVHPVTVDELRIAAAETYDVIVEPAGQDAFTLFAQDLGRTGFVRGTLATRPGLQAPVPRVDPRPILSMDDMGHGGHAGHVAAATGVAHGAGTGTQHVGMDHSAMGHVPAVGGAMDHAARGHAGMGQGAGGMQAHPASEQGNPFVDMQTMAPAPKLDDPGIGLRGNGRRALAYADLHSLFDDPDGREPDRTIELHLTGHMERFVWSFDGIKFSSADPLRLKYGERVRITLVNDTMMTHPIHLHGMWSDLEDANGNFLVRKHTIDMPPGTRRSYRVTADALGRWAYHCHLLFHMEAGMMREVRVEE